MRALESPFERYMSERILSFTHLMFSTVSEPKALKQCLRFAKFNFSEKLQNIFKIRFKKIWSVRTKIALIEKILRKMSERIFSFTHLMCPTVSEPKALKTRLRFAKFNFSEKLQNIFKIRFKKIWSVRTKIALIEKILRKKKFVDRV